MKKNFDVSELLNIISKMEFYSNFADGITKIECYQVENEMSVKIFIDIDENKNDGYICIPLNDLKELYKFESENTYMRIFINKDSIDFLLVESD